MASSSNSGSSKSSISGSVTRVWRTLGDIGELVSLVGLQRRANVHSHMGGMPRASFAWEMVQQQRSWMPRWLVPILDRDRQQHDEMSYLLHLRDSLDIFFEHFLYELPSDTHLINFLDNGTWNAGSCICRA